MSTTCNQTMSEGRGVPELKSTGDGMKAPRGRGKKGRNLRNPLAPYLFLAPFLILLLLFNLYPIIYSLAISFMKYKQGVFSAVGLKNYRFLFSDPFFRGAMLNTLKILIIQVPIQTFLAVVFANLMNMKTIKGKGFWRMVIFMPVLIDTVSYSIVFGLLFQQEHGFINQLFGVHVQWYNEPWPAFFLICIAVTWRWTGYNSIIILSGLQNISHDLYEAASIDGCGPLRKFRYITLPGLRPVILFSVIFSITGVLQLFTEPHLLTKGGPAGATTTIVQYIYEVGFRQMNFGLASSGAYVLCILIAVITSLQFMLSKGKK